MSGTYRKALLWCLFIPFMAVQAYLTAGPGGIFELYGYWDGFPMYFSMSLENPLLATGMIDFMTVAVIALVWLISEIPSQQRWTARTAVWVISYLVFPGLGFFLYFLWLNPGHRFVNDPPAT